MTELFSKFFESKIKIRIFAILAFSIFLIYFFPAFHTKWLIIFWDLDFWFYSKNYIDRIFPLWNDTWSTTNFFNSTRIFIVWIAHIVSSFFWYNAEFFQKFMIFWVLVASFFWMFLYVFQILKFEKDWKKLIIPHYLIFLIAFLVWSFYALNPWSIMRIQHFYLLVWYAILPFILYEILYFSEYKSVYKWKKLPMYHIIIASLFYIVAIWAVHYLFFIFFFVISWFIYRFIIFIFKKQYEFLIKFTAFFLTFWILVFTLLMYWLIPFFWASSISNINPTNLNTVELIWLFSRNSDWQNILYLTSYWWWMINFETFGYGYWIWWAVMIFSIFILNLFYLRNKFVFFFLIWSIILILASSWTYSFLADFYKYIVFDSPVSWQMWFIFRDPNKFVWLLALCYSILWATWIASFSSFLFKLRDKVIKEDKLIQKINNKKLSKIRWRYFLLKNLVFIFIFSFISISVIAYSFYIKPFKLVFINNFYSSVKEPEEYKWLEKYQKNDLSKEKYFYLPRYESHNSPWYNFWIAKWNRAKEWWLEKPMWYIDISSSIKKTFHPAEWATIYLPLFYNYIENYLEEWIWNNLWKYLSLVNIWKLVYHNDILWLEEYTKIQLQNLKEQENIKQVEKFWFMTVFEINEPLSKTSIFSKNIFHFGWMKTLENLFSIEQFDYKKFANIFVEQDIRINNWYKYEKESDIINIKVKEDLFLSYFDESHFLKPFKFNQNYNPFFKWSTMRLDIPDWKWHLKHIWINNWPWDFDLWKWLIFTYSSSTVSIKTYEDIYKKWKTILNLKDIVDISEFFKTNEDLVHISLDKTNKYDDIPSVKWNIIKWNSKNWMIWELKRQIVKENHPYTFQLILSWKWVNKIHGKVKFLDKDFKETWVDYVSAPQYVENFELMKFVWAFITPPWTKYLDFQISSIQKPEKNTYWWIHNFNFKDLWEYKIKNIQKMTYNFKEKWDYKIYSRVFNNKKWWEIWIKVNNSDYILDTKTEYINKFIWKEVWEIKILESWEKNVELENIKWFNWVNLIAFIKKEEIEKIEKKYKSNTLVKSKQISTFEAEDDFEIEWNIQSKIVKTKLSNWKSINLINWNIKTHFNLLKPWDYNILLKLNPFVKNSSNIEILVKKENKIIHKELYKSPSEFINLKINNLEIWGYELVIKVVDSSRAIIETSDLWRAKILRTKNNVNKKDLRFEENEKWCSFYQWISKNQIKYYSYPNMKKIILDRWTSCSWVSTTDNKLHKAEENKIFLIKYNLLKENTSKLHSRIEFYDKEKNFIKYNFVYDHSLWKDNVLNNFEKLITTPPKTKFIKFSFMQRQKQEFLIKSKFEVSNFKLVNYYDLPWIDSVIIYDNKSHIFDNTNKALSVKSTLVWKMNLEIALNRENKTPKLYIKTILWKWKTLFNSLEIDNDNLVISWDIDNILIKDKVIDIVSFNTKDRSLTVKDKNWLVSEIFFLNTFKTGKEFLNKFELLNIKNSKEEWSIQWKILQLSESYSQLWRIRKNDIDIEPIIINFFQNWYILENDLWNNFEIKFVIKKFMYIWYWVAISLFIILIYILNKYSKYRKIKITKKWFKKKL